MPVIDVLGERKAQRVMDETWGHLRPAPRRTYRGSMVVASDEYDGSIALVRIRFADRTGEELPDSPWFFEAMTDYLDSLGVPEGTIQRWEGTYRFTQGDGHVFTGAMTEIPTGGHHG